MVSGAIRAEFRRDLPFLRFICSNRPETCGVPGRFEQNFGEISRFRGSSVLIASKTTGSWGDSCSISVRFPVFAVCLIRSPRKLRVSGAARAEIRRDHLFSQVVRLDRHEKHGFSWLLEWKSDKITCFRRSTGLIATKNTGFRGCSSGNPTRSPVFASRPVESPRKLLVSVATRAEIRQHSPFLRFSSANRHGNCGIPGQSTRRRPGCSQIPERAGQTGPGARS